MSIPVNDPSAASSASIVQPSIFLPHGGGPCFFMDWTWGPADTWNKTQQFLASLLTTLPARPRAIVAVTAHWETLGFVASRAEQPGLIYDYSGFPEHTYELTWPAPGSPTLAAEVVQVLQQNGLQASTADRGYDHGVFVPLKVAIPAADIPVVSVSIERSLDPAAHLTAGRALAQLRSQNILILASGMSFHNLRAYFHPQATAQSAQFDAWLTSAVESPRAERERQLSAWADAPGARFSHPREEHLVPLFVAAGAGSDAPGRRIFTDQPMGAQISAYRFD